MIHFFLTILRPRMSALLRVAVSACGLALSVLQADDFAERFVRPGEAIGPWLLLGPVYDDVSVDEPGPTFQRTKHPARPDLPGYKTALALRRELEGIITHGTPKEGLSAWHRTGRVPTI